MLTKFIVTFISIHIYNYIAIKPGRGRFTAIKVEETHVLILPHIPLLPSYLSAVLFLWYPFPLLPPLIVYLFSLCLIGLARISRVILSNSSKSGYPCLVPDIKEEAVIYCCT